ncbi:methyl-accepting chemotaxis sensory transducer [Ureibacillus xyleni]|uniref:Methyl-accepting chemotaxis sensory transducer n=1 Tax=Ureibacillus xyleni TaxID=614648 RepID=A0A285SYB4_9BACL|nr:methyl-accepting chemotaxis protein [Ureibacillus xyleni]SOC13385.1 methyl-accepting chemotaxis sensory transducer [Ureibacillus xyleni]
MTWLNNLRIANKLKMLSGLTIVFLLIVGLVGVFYMNKMSDQTTDMYENQLLPIKWLNDIRAQSRANEALVKEIILTQDEADRANLINQVKERAQNIQEYFALYKETNLTDYEQERIGIISEEIQRIGANREQLYKILETGTSEDAFAYYKSNLVTPLTTLNTTLQDVAEYLSDRADETLDVMQSEEKTALTIMISVIVIASIIFALLSTVISKAIVNPLKDVVDVMKEAEKGDLTVRVNYESKDEIGRMVVSFNQLTESTRIAMEKVVNSANELAASSQQISASTEEIASGSQQQAQDATASAAMMAEMTNVVEDVAQNAEQAALLAENTMNEAKQGGVVINDAIQGMRAIRESIYELSNKSEQIGEIVEVIDDIAEQTNLLALNAAIEAARAGEAGKGFAVVADEVRKLAERSSKATKEISELVNIIQENTKDSVRSVEVGSEKAEKVDSTFNDILQLVGHSASKVTEIAAANEQQTAQAEEVQQAVSSIAAVTEEISAGLQETAATAETLAEMAESLNQLTAQFKIR